MQRLYLLRYRLFGNKTIVHILHIGRTGGSAIKYTLKEYVHSEYKPVVTDKYAIFHHEHYFKLKDIPEGEKAVFFVRDPVQRIYSGAYVPKLSRYMNAPLRHWLMSKEYLEQRRGDILYIGETERLDVCWNELSEMLGLPHIPLPKNRFANS